jgi:exodeoxyribonuclease-3
MNIPAFNVNGIRSRLPNVLEWLQRDTPDGKGSKVRKTSERGQFS